MARAFDVEGGHTEPVPAPRPAVHWVFRKQRRSQWCWAACIEMLSVRFGLRRRTQCAIVSDWLDRKDCCKHDLDDQRCNIPCPLDDVVKVCRRNGVTCQERHGALPEERLHEEIGDSPVLLAWLWADGRAGHLVLALWDHVEEDCGRSRILLADPGKGPSVVDYDELLNPRGEGGAWSRTWHRMVRATDAAC